MKRLLSTKDMMLSIDCIEVDCDTISKCCKFKTGEKALHFEIPPIINDFGLDAIEFIGSVDRQIQYVIYTDTSYQYHKYKKRGADKPHVYIETTPNSNGLYDGYIFNVPFAKYISVIGIFRDPRQLENYGCCDNEQYLDITPLANEIVKRLTEKKLRYYRQFLAPQTPNNMIPQ